MSHRNSKTNTLSSETPAALAYEVDDYIAMAQRARRENSLEEALEYYQKLLELLMAAYKQESKINNADSVRRVELLSSLEFYMSEAEAVKGLISINKMSGEASKAPNSDKGQQGKGTSLFSFFTSSMTSSKPPSTTAPHQASFTQPTAAASTARVPSSDDVTKPISAVGREASLSHPTTTAPLPDFHDYTAEAITLRRKNAGATARQLATPSGGTAANRAAPSKQMKQQASVDRLHGGGGLSPVRPRGNSTSTATDVSSKASTLPVPSSSSSSKPHNSYELQILDEMLDKTPGVTWSDIAGLGFAKQTLQEAVILPNLRPDLFTGLRAPPKGVLLFGPPGTGKTLLAKAVATESQFSFFSISSSSVTSKYIGDGEKLMKALFEIAREKQPSVIFFDEIDSLMSARKEGEHEASRRLKTEFMTQVDGAATSSEAGDRLLVMAATNIPWELDEAVLRRLARRIFIPLPDSESRRSLIAHLLQKQFAGRPPVLSPAQFDQIVSATDGYSGSDLTTLCQEAALGPIRELGPAALRSIRAEDIRPLSLQDFLSAVQTIRPSVSPDKLAAFQKWLDSYGVSR